MNLKYLLILLSILFFMPDNKPAKLLLAESKKKELLQEQLYNKSIHNWSHSIAEALHIINSKSYAPLCLDEAIAKALDAFVSIDTHCRFLNEQEYNELKNTTKGLFYGIGVKIAPIKTDDESLLILEVIPRSPADKNGILPFDKIKSIDGIELKNLTIDTSISKLKSKIRYSQISLEIIRDGKVIEITISRDIIKEEHLFAYYLPKQKILYIAITLFTQQIAKHCKRLLLKTKNKEINGIVLDLRNNAGGLLNIAVDCASLFLDKHSLVVTTKDKDQNILEKFYTSFEPIVSDIPIFIIVNNQTASAAEILAGSLCLHAKKNQKKLSPYVFMVGERTFGKGSVQEVIPMSNNCALKLTTSKYCFDNNKCLDKEGLIPDFQIEQLFCKKQLEGNNNRDYKSKRIESIINDHQIQVAINLISNLNQVLKLNRNLLQSRDSAYKWLKSNLIDSSDIVLDELT